MENERQEGDIIIDLNEGVVEEQNGTTDNSQNGQSDSDNQVDSGDQRFEGKTRDDLLESYRNLEKKLGEQGRLIGELKGSSSKGKGTKTPSEMKARIDELSSKIYSEDFDRFDKEDMKLQKEYDELNRNYASSVAQQSFQSTMAEKDNKLAVNEFKEHYEGIEEDVLNQVISFATSRMSDESGKISQADLEASFFRLQPERFKKFTSMKAKLDERDRIANAHNSNTPRLSATGNTNAQVNLTKLLQDNPRKAQEILRGLSNEQLAKIKR